MVHPPWSPFHISGWSLHRLPILHTLSTSSLLSVLLCNHQKAEYDETWLRTSTEIRYLFVLFSFLPFFAFQIIQFKNLINRNSILKNLYKFHLLYCSCIFLFFSEYFYLNRFLEIVWLFYPLYLLTLLNITKISLKL